MAYVFLAALGRQLINMGRNSSFLDSSLRSTSVGLSDANQWSDITALSASNDDTATRKKRDPLIRRPSHGPPPEIQVELKPTSPR